MTASSATASTFLVAVLIPGDDASPLQSLLVPAEERFATIIDPKNAINVIQSLLIRPTSEQPGLYGHHDPSATAMTHPNVRATRLAMACGLFSYRFHGDVIVSRGRHLAVDEIFSACCVSPDLRACLSLTVTIPEWLGNACRDNYHDADVLSRLAQVMNRPSEADENEDFDARSTASEDDPSGRDDKANPSSADIAKSEFVTKVPLCLHCRRPAFTLCPDCSGAYFCEPPATCRRNGWSHQCLCPTWKVYRDRDVELSSFPLGEWCNQLVGRDFQTSELPFENFLESQFNITKDGSRSWWSTEMSGWSGGESESAKSIDVSIRKSYAEGFYPLASIPVERHVTVEDVVDAGLLARNECGLLRLSSWHDYYKLRKIPETSPSALLLTFPATLYHAIVEYGQVPCTVARTILKRPLRIHIVGTEKEVNFVDLFKEVSFLLPQDFTLELVFVVRHDMLPPSLRTESHFTVDLTESLHAVIASGTYGDSLDPNFDCGSGPPDMIVAFNAGLYAYESWRSVVTYLDSHHGVVGVFTDYNEFSGVQCASLGGAASRDSVTVNPFRQPRAMPVFSMNLPQFSNCFLYVLNPQILDT